MVLKIDDKKAIVAEVVQAVANASSAVVADYRGLAVGEITDLRVKARNSGIYLKVVRNTLARRAIEGTAFSCLQEVLVGPLILAFSYDEPGAAARLIRDFAKSYPNLKVKALSLGTTLLDASQLDVVAKLPNRNEAIASLMGVILAPITKLVRTLAEPHAKFVRTLAAVRDQKQAAN